MVVKSAASLENAPVLKHGKGEGKGEERRKNLIVTCLRLSHEMSQADNIDYTRYWELEGKTFIYFMTEDAEERT